MEDPSEISENLDSDSKSSSAQRAPSGVLESGQTHRAYRLAGIMLLAYVLTVQIYSGVSDGESIPRSPFISVGLDPIIAVVDGALAIGLFQFRRSARTLTIVRAIASVLVLAPIMYFSQSGLFVAALRSAIQLSLAGALILSLTGKSQTWRLAAAAGTFGVLGMGPSLIALAVGLLAPPPPAEWPLREIDLRPLLIVGGDLPPGLSASQILGDPPEMFDGIPRPTLQIYQAFEKSGNQSGGVAVFLYGDLGLAEDAFEHILTGMGDLAPEELDLGDRSALNSILMPDTSEPMTDLLWIRCHSVVHVRIPSDRARAIAYGERLNKRLESMVCNDPLDGDDDFGWPLTRWSEPRFRRT